MSKDFDATATRADRLWVEYVARRLFKFDPAVELSDAERVAFAEYAKESYGGELRWQGVKIAVEEFR